MVLKDGRPIEHDFPSFQAAWHWTNEFVEGLERRRHGSRIHAPVFEIKENTTATQVENQIWRTCVPHTVVSHP